MPVPPVATSKPLDDACTTADRNISSRHASKRIDVNSVHRLVRSAYWSSTLVDGASRIIVPLHLAGLGVSPTGIGLTFVTSEFFGLLASLLAGISLRRLGYRLSFLLALFLQMLASAGYLLLGAQTRGQQLSLLLVVVLVSVLRAGHSIGKELVRTASSAFFKVLPPPSVDRQRLDVQVLLGGKDGIKGVGILVGGVLVGFLGLAAAFLVLMLISLVALGTLVLRLPDHRDRPVASRSVWRTVDSKLVWLAMARALLYGGRDVWLVVAGPLMLSAAGASDAVVGLALAAGLIVFGLSQPFTAYFWAKRWRPADRRVANPQWRAALVLAPFLAAVVPLILAVSGRVDSVPIVAAAVIAYNATAGFATVPHNRLHITMARPEVAASDLTVYRSISQLGKVVSVGLSGVLLVRYGFIGCLVASALFLIGSTAAAIVVAVGDRQLGSKGYPKDLAEGSVRVRESEL